MLPNCSTSSICPTITSGPATGASTPAAPRSGGMTIDFVLPFASFVISIGCITAPNEILPTIESASDGRRRARANSLERRSFPPVTVSNWPVAS
ncbi:MAG: hypothetical protein DMF24_11145 [Verrucomicrobia bacterium]|nr:MAG: hypothetical protein DMF24_11145 [Verrucomicrobiota bacterium]